MGHVTGITDRIHTTTHTCQYDALHRLTQATGSDGLKTYASDPLGHLIAKEGATLTYGGPGGTKPHAVTSTSDDFSLAYDANGNLTQESGDT